MGSYQSNEQSKQPQLAEASDEQPLSHTCSNANGGEEVVSSTTTPENTQSPAADKTSSTKKPPDSPDTVKCSSSEPGKTDTIARKKKPFVAKVADVFRRRKSVKPTPDKLADLKQSTATENGTQAIEEVDGKAGSDGSKTKADDDGKTKPSKSKKNTWCGIVMTPPKWVMYCLLKILSWLIPKPLKKKLIAMKTACENAMNYVTSMRLEVKLMIALLVVLVGMCLILVLQNQQLLTTILQENAARSNEASEINRHVKQGGQRLNAIAEKVDERFDRLEDKVDEFGNKILANQNDGWGETSNDPIDEDVPVGTPINDKQLSRSTRFISGAKDVLGSVAGGVQSVYNGVTSSALSFVQGWTRWSSSEPEEEKEEKKFEIEEKDDFQTEVHI